MNSLRELAALGQSIWLDAISRELIESGELARRIREDDLRGVTSNPAIFEKAISGSEQYRAILERLVAEDSRAGPMQLYERLAIGDIQDAADVLKPVFDRTRGRDGYVSLEVTLKNGADRAAILAEARHLHAAVARPNVMIKVPGSAEGIAAFEALTGEGINVNVTLLFAVETYVRVAEAYLAGLEAFARAGGDLSKAASVASFFVSRIDTAVDKLLEDKLAKSARAGERVLLRSLLGKAAIANAKIAWTRYREVVSGDRWKALAAKGAMTQRLLWASTSTKNPRYHDVMYVEELIEEDTVDTAPAATLDAFRDHGRVRPSLREGIDEARDVIAALPELGIDFAKVTDRLLDEGLKIFGDAFDKLLATVEAQRKSARFAARTSP